MQITSPASRSFCPSNGSIDLAGSVYDIHKGLLEGTALWWSSNKDGALGTGENLYRVRLSASPRTVMLSAADSAARISNTSALVRVGEVKQVFLPPSAR